MATSRPPIERLELFFGQLRMGSLLAGPTNPSRRVYAVELIPEFLSSRYEIAPVVYPFLDAFRSGLIEYHEGPDATSPFAGGLPGFLADSLPDQWGALLASHEDPQRAASLMGMLSRVGAKGQGAIIFKEPDEPPTAYPLIEESLASLTKRAYRLYKNKAGTKAHTLPFSSGGSLGGIYPKAVIHLPTQMRSNALMLSHNVLIGGDTPADHVPCIVKFSPLPDDEFHGAVEFAFHNMARAAGLRMPAACLLEDDSRGRHFAVERFDRKVLPDGKVQRLHLQSLSALLHRRPVGEIHYRDFVKAASFLGGAKDAQEAFRRVVFNLLSTNRDDHGRNHAFLYNPATRTWAMAPAYDLNPSVGEALHAIRWGDGSEIPQQFSDLLELALAEGIAKTKVIEIFQQVEDAIEQWPHFATAAGVGSDLIKTWGEGILSKTKHGGPLRADARAYRQQLQKRGHKFHSRPSSS
jgi:serine/threonine-protein kinase HipA